MSIRWLTHWFQLRSPTVPSYSYSTSIQLLFHHDTASLHRTTNIMNAFGASQTIVRPTSVDLKSIGSWGMEGLNKAPFTFDT